MNGFPEARRPDGRRRRAVAVAILAIALAPLRSAAQAGDPVSPFVSDDGHRLIHEDGTPFFWLGDTAWELFHRLNAPNPYGAVPLEDHDPTRPVESYFAHVDYVVDEAEARALFIGLLPTWGDGFNKTNPSSTLASHGGGRWIRWAQRTWGICVACSCLAHSSTSSRIRLFSPALRGMGQRTDGRPGIGPDVI